MTYKRIRGWIKREHLSVPKTEFSKWIKITGKMYGGTIFHKGREYKTVDVFAINRKGKRYERVGVESIFIRKRKGK
jgi:hypothetical protein